MFAARFGLRPVLIAGAALSPASMLLYAWLSARGHDLVLMVAAVSADNFIGGAASSAFIAYLSSLTNIRFTATQYALFSSVMLMLPKSIAIFSGVAVDHFGYPAYFVGAGLLGLPGLLGLLAVVRRLLAVRLLVRPALGGVRHWFSLLRRGASRRPTPRR